MLARTYKRDGVPTAMYFGIDYPSYFVDPAAEYMALSRNVGVIDLTHWRTFRITGKDRVTFLNAMVTGDIAALREGQGSHSLITTIRGKIVAELLVMLREDHVVVVVPQGNADEAHDILQKHIISEDVSIEDVSSRYGVIALEGGKAEDVMWRIFSTGPFPKETLQSYTREFGKESIFLFRYSVTGEDGYHLLIHADHIAHLRDYLVQAARGSDGLPAGGIAWNMRRVENGLPWYGTDFDEENLPDESRLGATISYTKGCFRGQETLARLHHRGHVNRMLVGLTIEQGTPEIRQLEEAFAARTNNYDEVGLREKAGVVDRQLALPGQLQPGTELFAIGAPRGKTVGRITSVAFSPLLKKPLWLGYIRRQTVTAGDAVQTADGTTLVQVDLPVSGTDSG